MTRIFAGWRSALVVAWTVFCLAAIGCRDRAAEKPPSGASSDVSEPDIQVGSETNDDSPATEAQNHDSADNETNPPSNADDGATNN